MSSRATAGRVLRTSATASAAVAGLRQHLDARLGLEDQPQPLPDKSLVVGDHDGDRVCHRPAPL